MRDKAAWNNSVQRVTIIGSGVIGTSWAALFLAHDLHVVVHDVDPTSEERLRNGIDSIKPTLKALGLKTTNLYEKLRFDKELSTAVSQADLIQECGPDRVAFKRNLWAEIERYAPGSTIFVSSSSGITTKVQAGLLREPGRLLIGHPFNPPHLVPLVEVVPHSEALPQHVECLVNFYRAVGKTPICLRKEIPGFAANRLQTALLREAILLVKLGVVSVDEVDAIVTNSLGLRWAVDGPFRSLHLGGGAAGFEGYLKQFSRGLQLLWLHSALHPFYLGKSLKAKILDQIKSSFGRSSIQKLEGERDERQLAVLNALHPNKKDQQESTSRR